MSYPSHCPHCMVCLDGEDILEVMMRQFPGDKEKALESADCYGWTPENNLKFNRATGIYCLQEDKVTHWVCPDCKMKFKR